MRSDFFIDTDPYGSVPISIHNNDTLHVPLGTPVNNKTVVLKIYRKRVRLSVPFFIWRCGRLISWAF